MDLGESDSNVLLNLGDDKAWTYCFETVSSLIEELQVDTYRQDFNFGPLWYWQKNDAEGRMGISEIKYINGLYKFLDALLERFPHLMIDNCASGGRRIDFEMLTRSTPLWRSDYMCSANFDVDVTQAQTVNFGTWLPYSGTGTGRKWLDTYRFRSSYSPALTTNYFFSERENIPEKKSELMWLKKSFDEFLSVREYLTSDIYPLSKNLFGSDIWCAVQYNRPEENDGLLTIYVRPDAPYDNATYKLRGLEKTAEYQFRDLDNDSVFTMTGQDIMEKGIRFEISEKRKAMLFTYKMV